MKKIVPILVVALAATAVAVWWFSKPEEAPVAPEPPKKAAVKPAVKPATMKPAAPAKTAGKKGNRKPRKDRRRVAGHDLASLTAARTDISSAEKKLLLDIGKALEAESFKDLMKLQAEAAASTNAEIRGEFVDALDWFGEPAVLEFLPFMADKDEDVSKSALDGWSSALSEVSNEKTRAQYVESAMKIVTDEDALKTMISELDDCDEVVALQSVLNVINSDNAAAVEVAREQYEFMTGEKYTDLDTANDWVNANYQIENKDGTVNTINEIEAAEQGQGTAEAE